MSITRTSRFKSLLFRVASFALGLVVALVLAEWAVRIIDPQELVSDVLQAEPDLEYRLRPNAVGHMISSEFSAQIRVNSLGFRGKEIALHKQPGVCRVLFLGDSFVFGDGLDEDETLPYVVGQKLDGRQPGRFEVINGGVYGYCTAQELTLFRKYGHRLRPDVVVLLVMVHDMADNAQWCKLTQDGQLERIPRTNRYEQARQITRYLPGSSWFRGHSHLFKFIGLRLLHPAKRRHGRTRLSKDDPFSTEFYRDERGPFRITAALLSELAKSADAHAAKPVLLTLHKVRKTAHRYASATGKLPHDRLSAAARVSGFLETVALSSLLARHGDTEKLFYPIDGHWRPVAVRLVASDVADTILRLSGAD